MVRLPRRFALAGLLSLLVGCAGLAQAQSTPDTPATTPPARPVAGTLRLGGEEFRGLRPVAGDFASLTDATNITDGNGIDEIYLKDQQGRYYIAYGYYANLENKVKRGFRGSVGDLVLEVVHVNNEMNTASEGFTSSLDDIKTLVKTILPDNPAWLVGGAVTAVLGRELIKAIYPTVATAIRAAAPTLMRFSGYGLAAAAGWVAFKTIYGAARRLLIEGSKNSPTTIAMVTATNARQLHETIRIPASQRREATPRQLATEVLRRVSPDGTITIGDGDTGDGLRSRGTPAPAASVRAPPPAGSDPFGDLRNR